MIRTILLTLTICTALAKAQVHERWNVKTLTDGFKPDIISIQKFSTSDIQKLPRTKVGNNESRLPLEKHLVAIRGKIVRMALETDGDYHIEVQGTGMDSTVVCEAINPEDSIAGSSPYVERFKAVRAIADSLKLNMDVVMTGVLFQDKYHSPSRWRTRNFIELHPLLSIDFPPSK